MQSQNQVRGVLRRVSLPGLKAEEAPKLFHGLTGKAEGRLRELLNLGLKTRA